MAMDLMSSSTEMESRNGSTMLDHGKNGAKKTMNKADLA